MYVYMCFEYVSGELLPFTYLVVKWIERVDFEKSCRNLINHSKIKMRKCEMQRVKGVNWEDRATSSLGLLRMKVDFKRVSHRRVIVSRIGDAALRCVEIVERDPLHRFLIVKRFPVSSAARKLVSWLSILSFLSPFFSFFLLPSIFDQSNFSNEKYICSINELLATF